MNLMKKVLPEKSRFPCPCMDNRVFNVNGMGDEMLAATLELAFAQESSRLYTCVGWISHPEHGLILLNIISSDPGEYRRFKPNVFPSELSAKEVAPLVSQWLRGKDTRKILDRLSDNKKYSISDRWDINTEHDGSNSEGWRVYCEDWGKVDDLNFVLCAVKPAYIWHGK